MIHLKKNRLEVLGYQTAKENNLFVADSFYSQRMMIISFAWSPMDLEAASQHLNPHRQLYPQLNQIQKKQSIRLCITVIRFC